MYEPLPTAEHVKLLLYLANKNNTLPASAIVLDTGSNGFDKTSLSVIRPFLSVDILITCSKIFDTCLKFGRRCCSAVK